MIRFVWAVAIFSLFFGLATSLWAAEQLTIERIFSDPSLDGPRPRELQVAPDGSRVTFLQGKAENFEQLDLWEFHVKDHLSRSLVDSKVLLPGEEKLSAEEKSRRERQRISAFKGIVEYSWADNGSGLLFPLNGDIYYHDLRLATGSATKRLTSTETYETDVRFSPGGNYVSFIRDANLFIIDLKSGQEKQLTFDGKDLVQNGVAEFVAQEEMDRYTGYWWADDESQIAFSQIDESPVQVSNRYEIYADSIEISDQRYPAAGTPNVLVKLGVVNIKSAAIRWIDLGPDKDIYLARVNWLPDSKKLAIQRQSRNQQKLDLLLADIGTGQVKPLLSESSSTWLNLHNDLTFLKKQSAFVWASERSGYKHLYLYDLTGRQIRALTRGKWVVDELQGVDEKNDRVYFSASVESPLEHHLYSVALSGGESTKLQKITSQPGWHRVALDKHCQLFVDTWSDPENPPQVSLFRIDGNMITTLVENRLDARHPYYPYRAARPTSEFGTIKAEDGQDLYYHLLKPVPFDPKKRYPVFVSVYGGPGGPMVKKAWGGSYNHFHEYMAQHGYVVFILDNRGTGYRGTAFDAPIYHQMGAVEVQDQVAGVRFLQTLPYVDPQRVGIFGWSYGGYMTVKCLLQAPEVFKVGAAVAPVTDWKLYDTHYTERYLGTPQQNPEGYEKSSVFPYLDGLKGSLLLIHGMADDNVLFTHTTRLIKALEDRNIPFDMLVYPGSKHSLDGKQIRSHVFSAIARFFDRNLK